MYRRKKSTISVDSKKLCNNALQSYPQVVDKKEDVSKEVIRSY